MSVDECRPSSASLPELSPEWIPQVCFVSPISQIIVWLIVAETLPQAVLSGPVAAVKK